MSTYRSWGIPANACQSTISPSWRGEVISELGQANYDGASSSRTVLAFGNGRSYGDSCLNNEGTLIHTQYLNKLISFDREEGSLSAESGVTLRDLLGLVIPAGWCLPVSPGTSFVTLGGAVANDVHGKNHHVRGSFGNHVKSLSLLRSDGETIACSENENQELFRATIGGLGLTGLILSVEIALIPVQGSLVDCVNQSFNGLDEFLFLSEKFSKSHEYTVAWLDCVSRGRNCNRGVFTAANHSTTAGNYVPPGTNKIFVPFNFPSIALNRLSVKTFNSLYYHVNTRRGKQQETVPLNKLFYPLDAIGNWNRIYGAAGFYQFQFVVPMDRVDVLTQIMFRIRQSGLASFLAVLKVFGQVPSLGMMSFSRSGLCLALDFAYRYGKTETLLKDLENIVIEANGAIYPAKDRLMSRESFEVAYPKVHQFKQFVDAAYSSDYWRRVAPEE